MTPRGGSRPGPVLVFEEPGVSNGSETNRDVGEDLPILAAGDSLTPDSNSKQVR